MSDDGTSDPEFERWAIPPAGAGAPLANTKDGDSIEEIDHTPEDEIEEVARFCRRCGTAKADFDVFCNECMSPLIRRFRFILPAEIVLFLASAVIMALAHFFRIPTMFRMAPLFFIGQLVLLYYLRASLRQKRFWVLIALYGLLVGSGVLGYGIHKTFAAIAPIYVAVGVAVLWGKEVSRANRWASMQTVWPGILVVGMCVCLLTRLDSVLSPLLETNSLFYQIGNALGEYTPWLSLAGLSVTLAIRAGQEVGEHGVRVKSEFYPGMEKDFPTSPATGSEPLFAVPFIMFSWAWKKAVASFYNTMLRTLNFITRSIVFVWSLVKLFLVMLWREVAEMLVLQARYFLQIFGRVFVPLFSVYLAAKVSMQCNDVIEHHTFNPSVQTGLTLIWVSLQIVAALFFSVLGFARTSPQALLEGFSRDLAALVGYGIPVLLLCVMALFFGNKASQRYLGVDLDFQIGPVSWLCLTVLALGAAYLWRDRLLRILRHVGQRAAIGRSGKGDGDRGDRTV